MKITLLAHHIEWDTDGDMDAARALPSKMEVEIDLNVVDGCLTGIPESANTIIFQNVISLDVGIMKTCHESVLRKAHRPKNQISKENIS